MSKKATHFGTCQACGSVQKLPNGELANHGYTVKWGFFQRTCPGSRRLPFEQSYDFVEQCIDSAKLNIKYTKQDIEKWLNNDTNTIMWHHYVTGRGGGRRVWIKGKIVDGEIQLENDVVIKSLIKYSLYGTDSEIARKLDLKYVASLERRIKELNEYIEWQQKRVDSWIEGELTPIKKVS